MYVLPHDLDHEFPEFSQLLHELREHDDTATVLMAEYDRVNGTIVDIEENDRPYQDFEFESLKKERLRIKDELYRHLKRVSH